MSARVHHRIHPSGDPGIIPWDNLADVPQSSRAGRCMRDIPARRIEIQFTRSLDYQLFRRLFPCITDEPLRDLMEISAASEFGLKPEYARESCCREQDACRAAKKWEMESMQLICAAFSAFHQEICTVQIYRTFNKPR